MNHNIVTQQTYLCPASDQPFGYHTAANLADAGDIKDIANLGITQKFFPDFR